MSDRLYTAEEQPAKKSAYDLSQAQQANTATPGEAIGGMLGCEQTPMRETMSARFRSSVSRLRRDHRKLDQLNELTYLLDKNPELARILDLVDMLGNGY